MPALRHRLDKGLDPGYFRLKPRRVLCSGETGAVGSIDHRQGRRSMCGEVQRLAWVVGAGSWRPLGEESLVIASGEARRRLLDHRGTPVGFASPDPAGSTGLLTGTASSTPVPAGKISALASSPQRVIRRVKKTSGHSTDSIADTVAWNVLNDDCLSYK